MCGRLHPALGLIVLLSAAHPIPVPGAGLGCSDLSTLRIEDANLLSSVVVPAKDGLPEYCRVLGIVRPATNFELRLPANEWNGKFYMTGCGAFCGRLDSDLPGFTNALNHGLRRGYAAATMDGGHWGSSRFDGRWAWNNRVAENDWGWRAVTETARVSKSLLASFYGRPQQKSYFAGCSTGGRMALMEAQRFPADFDGIIAGAPALDYTGLVATSFAWVVQANTRPDGNEILDRRKVAGIAAAVTAACDAIDGRKDGLIDDPRACHWTPSSLACDRKRPDSCLTPDEVTVLEKWYAGPRSASGVPLYPGAIPRGSEPYWPLWLTGNPANGNPALVPLLARDFLRYMAFQDDPGETYDVRSFDFVTDPPRLSAMSRVYDAIDPDLRAFAARGGKLIVYHGWADPIVTPFRTVRYLEDVQRSTGGAGNTSDFMRLFMIPGFDHCGLQAGPGPNDAGFDPLPALEDWVEHGVPPESIPASRRGQDGTVDLSLSVCAYPSSPRCETR